MREFRVTWMLGLLVLCAGLAVVALRAAAQSLMTDPAPAAATPAPPALHADASPATTAGAAAPASSPAPASPAAAALPATQAPPAPPLPAAGAIRDEPEVAPDKKESADNNVSFPVDI